MSNARDAAGVDRQVAIACQGGGSHTAFTAGVLSVLVREQSAQNYAVMGLSGTSGGAICALLAWYGLLTGGPDRAADLLKEFWRDATATLPWEQVWNAWTVAAASLPFEARLSPYTLPFALLEEQLQFWAPRKEFVDLRALIERFVTTEQIAGLGNPECPVLLVGAVDILEGAFKAFNSASGEISVNAVLASAALPWLSRAVEDRYWDGLFSQNPPIRNFLADPEYAHEKPDEIWVLQINPQRRAALPLSTEEIQDRRNELSGNLSLNQELEHIYAVNRWLATGCMINPPGMPRYKPVAVYRIEMDSERLEALLKQSLDAASKLDRRQELIQTLMAQGAMQASLFLPVRHFVEAVWNQRNPAAAKQIVAAAQVADLTAQAARIPGAVSAQHPINVEAVQIRDASDNPEQVRGVVTLRWRHTATPVRGDASFTIEHGRIIAGTIVRDNKV